MTEHDLLNRIDLKLDKLGEKLDILDARFDDYRVKTEGRLTKMEVRSSLVGGALGAVLSYISYTLFGKP